MQLRGFDHYEVTLGDEMRGERASLGKTLEEAARDLRIKSELLEAVENCDLSPFPNASVVSGYVRSYARFLGMDQEDVYNRFCDVTGFQPPNAALSQPAMLRGSERGLGAPRKASDSRADSVFENSRFAVSTPKRNFTARVSLGSVVSCLALVGLVAGLSYGGYALLQNVQRIGFEPLPEAPQVMAEAPEFIKTPNVEEAVFRRPDAAAYGSSGALAAVFDDTPPIQRRDGPISAIDPETNGLFLPEAPGAAPELALREVETGAGIDSADDAIAAALRRQEIERQAAIRLAAQQTPGEAAATETAAVEKGIAVQAQEAAWVRIRDGSGAILFEGILAAGDRFDLPERAERATIRTGNAGATYFIVDGQPYGPLGRVGRVAHNVSLAREDIAANQPVATAAFQVRPQVETAVQRAAVLAGE